MSGSRGALAARCGAVALLSLLAAGCASHTTTVSGTVTFRGQTVTSGSVILYCGDKQIVHGIIGHDGRYTIPNVPRGPAVVTVQTHPRTPHGMQYKMKLPPSVDGPIPPAADPGAGGRVVAIPRRYGLPEESGLSITADRDFQTHDIDLKP